ncbi:hypothetical protein [Clostridium oryzae]|uniref:hypothetical protein n=1 Tax=Clostridium oryzae TaxID=1450648 RepID=UPI0009A512DB|nr:hypothetical protein [Clostridium oryzae]
MKYIGPFLRITALSKENIEKQLSYFSRESFKHIVLKSRCGICTSVNNLKLKNIPNFDINIFKKNSPLLCIYKKANAKYTCNSDYTGWDENTFKKEFNVSSNAFMTLCLLDFCNYYENFKDIDNKLFSVGKLYEKLAFSQLEFYSSNFRNNEGVFVDKKEIAVNSNGTLELEDKAKKFKYSDQALLMSAFYQASTFCEKNEGESYKAFALDILNMFLNYKHEIYNLSFDETNRLCFAMNIFYNMSKNKNSEQLLIDLCDLLIEKYEEKDLEADFKNENIDNVCLVYLNLLIANKNFSIFKFKQCSDKIIDYLLNLYDNERAIFLLPSDKKDIDYGSSEIVMYILSCIAYTNCNNLSDLSTLNGVYKNQLINSGIVLSWPDVPSLESVEKYKNYSLKSEDLIEDASFRSSSLPTPESSELAPIFLKSTQYNIKKDIFSSGKNTFDSTKNMPLLFMIQYVLNFFSNDSNQLEL